MQVLTLSLIFVVILGPAVIRIIGVFFSGDL